MKFKVVLLASLLLVILTLSSGIAFALLDIDNIVGSSEIEGYRSVNDTVGILVTSSSEVSLDGGTCTKTGSSLLTYTCVITDEINSAQANYKIINSDGNEKIATINVDNNIGEIGYTLTNNQNNISITYTVNDLGFNNNNACSGIKKIIIYDGTTKLTTIDVNSNPGTCPITGTSTLSIASSGTKKISVEVTDNVGNIRVTPVEEIVLDLDAPEIINGLMIKYSGTNDEIGTISSSASFLVDIYFSIREETLDSITLNLSELNTNPVIKQAYSSVNVPLSNCEINTSSNSGKVYDCVIRGIQLRLAENSISINVSATDIYGSIGSKILSKSLSIDDVIPQASIITDRCTSSGICYIKNGENKIIIKLNKNNFDKKYVFFDLPGSTFGINRVQNCSGNECYAIVPLTCTSGSSVTITITSFSGFSSQDDSGNALDPFSTIVYCDNNAPIIKDVFVRGDSSSVIQEIVSGSTITILANITEIESEELNAYLYLDKIKNSTEKGTCDKISEYDFTCSWTVSNINTGYYDANIIFNISDISGNTVFKTHSVKVLGEKSDNDTPDNLAISLIKVQPKEVNRIVLDMATKNNIPYYVYATYKLSVVKGIGVEALHQDVSISNCVYRTDSGETGANAVFSEVTLSNPYAKVGETGRVDLKFKDGLSDLVNQIDDEFIISCNISVMQKENNNLYKKPQLMQLDMKFKLANSKLCNEGEDCTPGAVFGEKIHDSENKWIVRSKLMATINNLIPKLQSVCKVKDYLAMGTFASNAASIAIHAFGSTVGATTGGSELAKIPILANMKISVLENCLTAPKKTSQKSFLDKVKDSSSSAATSQVLVSVVDQEALSLDQKQDIYSKCQNVVGTICEKLTCDVAKEYEGKTSEIFKSENPSDKNRIPDFFDGDGFGNEAGYALTRNINVPDVSNSLVMSVSMGCWPATYYNINKWRQTECNYLYCLKMASYSGTDISTCDKVKYAQTCSLIVGEIFELPYAREIKNVMNNAADMIRNFFPLAAASLVKKTVCPEYLDFKTGNMNFVEAPSDSVSQAKKIYLCQVPLQIARFADQTSRSKQKDKFVYPEMADMCVYATCVGEKDCNYLPDFWDTLNKMDLSSSGKTNTANPFDKNSKVAEINKKKDSLNKLNKYQLKIEKSEKDSNLKLNDAETAEYTKLREELGITDTDVKSQINSKINYYNNVHKFYVNCLNTQGVDCDKYIDNNMALTEEGLSLDLIATTPEAYALLPVSERIYIDDSRLIAITQASQLSTQITETVNARLVLGNNFTTLTPDQQLKVESLNNKIINLTLERKNLLNSLNVNSSQSGDSIKSELNKEKEETINRLKLNNEYKKSQDFGNSLYIGLQFANANRLIDWMFSDYWLKKIFGGVDLADYFDFDKYKESLCNPNNPINLGNSGFDGSVVSCTSGNCIPVLTYATERSELEYPNGTKYYIYTVAYYVSSGDSRGAGNNVTYNIYFKGPERTLQGHIRDISLKSFEIKYLHRVFKTSTKYTKMCVEFDDPFPIGNSIMDRKEYCRDIKTTVFDNGSPMFDEETTSTGTGIGNTNSNTVTDENSDIIGVLD
ncbi:MAG: hypothetical protein ACP5N1_02340 [Candidatus Woesearchaeota archaeon]